MRERKKRKSAWDSSPSRIASAEAVLRESRRLLRDPDGVLAMLAAGRSVHLPLRTDLGVMASLFDAIHRGDYAASPLPPDVDALVELLRFCRAETDLLTAPDAPRFADALLALSAHRRDWIRPLRDWRKPSHNVERQFRTLVRHLVARYDVPAFLDAAWLEGLTVDAVKYQGWYKHIASGRNIRTAPDLPIPLTKKQAHHFLRAPDDFDIASAFRWAVIVDLGGDERMVRSILGTWVGTNCELDAFWLSVFRFFAAHPMLDPAHHGAIVDFLRHQRFEPSVSNPLAGRPGEPELVPAQPNLSMKGRSPESLLQAIREWHRSLARGRAKSVAMSRVSWEPSGFPGFEWEAGAGEESRVYRIVELLSESELFEEGRTMRHCVASYVGSCTSRRTSIWSLRKSIEDGRVIRLVTIEVNNARGTIVQVRGRYNRLPTEGERALLASWGEAGGPALSYWMTG